MLINFAPMTIECAREIVSWRYEEPYRLYNLLDSETFIQTLADPDNQYFCVLDQDEQIIAFRCYGVEARVPGGDYSGDALDTGGGLRPDLTGQGLGLTILQAGLDFGRERFQPSAFRVTVASFNKRALRVCHRAGFEEIQTFKRPPDDREFVVLRRKEDLKKPRSA